MLERLSKGLSFVLILCNIFLSLACPCSEKETLIHPSSRFLLLFPQDVRRDESLFVSRSSRRLMKDDARGVHSVNESWEQFKLSYSCVCGPVVS